MNRQDAKNAKKEIEGLKQKRKISGAIVWMERLRLVKSFQFTTRLTPEECVDAIQEITQRTDIIERYDAEFIQDGQTIRFDFVPHSRRSRKNDVSEFIRGEIQDEPNMYLTRVRGKVYPTAAVLWPLMLVPFIMPGVVDYGLRFIAGQLDASQTWFLFMGVIFIIILVFQVFDSGRMLLRYFLQEVNEPPPKGGGLKPTAESPR